jgi:hypothetical protein
VTVCQRSGIDGYVGEQAAHAREKEACQFLGSHNCILALTPPSPVATGKELGVRANKKASPCGKATELADVKSVSA